MSEGRQLALGGPKQRVLLAELLLHRGAVLPRDHLVDALWEEPPTSARSSLQVYVHGLRQVLGSDRIVTHGDGYRIAFEPAELDVARFERLVGRAERAFAEERTGAAADDLDAALALWAGPPLADVADQPAARAATPRLEELRLRALELRNDAQLALGRHDALLAELESLVAAHPYRERLREQQILALYRAGRQKDALEAYRDARRTLVEELGVEPGRALQELERAILRQDPELAAPEIEAELGRTKLPVPATQLIGRRLERAAVEAILRREDARLVTLTGPGGTGKTRLALAVAEEIGPELRDGAVFVDLAAVVDAELVLPTVATALGLPDDADLLEWLGDRAILLVLDNLEQLGESVKPIGSLLTAGPRVRVLATSRTPLRLGGERDYPVPPLSVPGPGQSFEELASNDAVRLFTVRAQGVDADFALTDANAPSVAGICRRLDGLPLGLELAAARVKVLPPKAIEERLGRALELLVAGARDLPLRQRTLRATLDWSYGLLDPAAQSLLARLSVFVGGATLADAEAVLGEDVVLGLEQLLDGSLVRRRGTPDSPRFGQLETIRQYGLERLDEAGETEALRRRHAHHFAEVAERARADIVAGGDAEEAAMAILDAEVDNMRAALTWAFEHDEIETAAGLASAHRWFWNVRGHYREALAVFERLVEVTDERSSLHAVALTNVGIFIVKLGDCDAARQTLEKALELHRELGDAEEVARCVAELGAVAVADRRLDDGAAAYEEAVVLFAELGHTVRQTIALSNIAGIYAQQGEPAKAAEYGVRAIAMQRENGDIDGLAVSLANLARVRIDLDELPEARTALEESIELGVRIGYRMLIAYALGAAAELAARDGQLERAARLLGAGAGQFAELGMPVPEDEIDEHERTLARIGASLDPVQMEALRTEGAALSMDAAVADALDVTRR